jgi:hypothetical protein
MKKPTREEVDADREFCIIAQFTAEALRAFQYHRWEAGMDAGLSMIADGLAREIDIMVDSLSLSDERKVIDECVKEALPDYLRNVRAALACADTKPVETAD